MRRPELTWIGLGGVPPEDNPAAYIWERRLHWAMIGVALLSIPGFYFEELSTARPSRIVGSLIETFILVAFVTELVWMLRLTRHPAQYLVRNWLDLLVILFSMASLAGAETEWVAMVRLMRLTIVGLLVLRAFGASRRLFRRGGLPYILAFGLFSLLMSGFGFYWLEPTVKTYGEGLWLAFVTGATIGYGDFVPTTTAARFFAVFIVTVGVAVMSMLTASIAALLVGEDETRLRQEMHADIRDMRREMARLIGEEERVLLREMHADVQALRDEVRRLRDELHAVQKERG